MLLRRHGPIDALVLTSVHRQALATTLRCNIVLSGHESKCARTVKIVRKPKYSSHTPVEATPMRNSRWGQNQLTCRCFLHSGPMKVKLRVRTKVYSRASLLLARPQTSNTHAEAVVLYNKSTSWRLGSNIEFQRSPTKCSAISPNAHPTAHSNDVPNAPAA